MTADALQQSREIYAKATDLFIRQHTTDERKRQWVADYSNLDDIEAAVRAAKTQYEGRKHSPVRKALARFSDTFMYYSKIGDMFAQQHPEYASLAWGTMKLLFVLVINHEETITKLAESLASIAETLPRMDIHLSLYPTAMMKRNVEELYALLIKFYHRTLRWYSAGPLKHLVKSLTRPYSLEFADILRQMDTRARLIDSLAIAMAHDELRAMFNLLSGGLEEQKRFRDEFANIWPTLAQMQDAQSQTGKQIESVRELIICHQKVNSAAIQQTQEAAVDLQITMMISGTTVDHVLKPYESLQKRLAICRYKTQQGRQNMKAFWNASQLASWNQVASSSLLIVRGTAASRNEVDAAATLMTDLVFRETKVPIMWALKSSRTASDGCSLTDLIKYIVMQVIKFDPVATGRRISESFNSSRVTSASTEQEWANILSIVLSSFPLAYLVIDAEFIGASGRKMESLQLLLRTIHDLIRQTTGTVIKVAFLTYRKTALISATAVLPNLQQIYSIQFEKLVKSAVAVKPRTSRLAKEHSAFKEGIALHSQKLAKLESL